MRKKSGLTIVEQAMVLFHNWEISIYIRRIALFVVHFGKLPEQIDPDVIIECISTKKIPETEGLMAILYF